MELSAATAGSYLRHAFDQMLDVADRVGESGINERPLGVETNSVASLIIHCSVVSEFWLGHVALGRSSRRVRHAEFAATATLAELHDLLATSLAQTIADVGRLEAGEGGDEGGRQFLLEGDTSDASVVLHVLEEFYQHLGHMELAADALK